MTFSIVSLEEDKTVPESRSSRHPFMVFDYLRSENTCSFRSNVIWPFTANLFSIVTKTYKFATVWLV